GELVGGRALGGVAAPGLAAIVAARGSRQQREDRKTREAGSEGAVIEGNAHVYVRPSISPGPSVRCVILRVENQSQFLSFSDPFEAHNWRTSPPILTFNGGTPRRYSAAEPSRTRMHR